MNYKLLRGELILTECEWSCGPTLSVNFSPDFCKESYLGLCVLGPFVCQWDQNLGQTQLSSRSKQVQSSTSSVCSIQYMLLVLGVLID